MGHFRPTYTTVDNTYRQRCRTVRTKEIIAAVECRVFGRYIISQLDIAEISWSSALHFIDGFVEKSQFTRLKDPACGRIEVA